MQFFHLAAISAASLFFGGCVTLPSYPSDEITTSAVVQNIKCEFHEAVRNADPDDSWLNDWNAILALNLVVDDKGGVSSDATLTHLIVPAIFTPSVSVSVSGQARRTEKITFTESISKIRLPQPFGCPSDHAILLGGRIGIEDLLRRARLSMLDSNITPTQLDYTLDFTVVRTGNISPRFSMVPLRGLDTLGVGARLEATRLVGDTLNITLKPTERASCKLFPEYFEETGICPSVVATLPLENARPKKISKGRGGVSIQDQRVLEDALGRSILQNTDQKLRDLNIQQ